MGSDSVSSYQAKTRAGRKNPSFYVIISGELQQSIVILVLSFLKAKCSEHFMFSS